MGADRGGSVLRFDTHGSRSAAFMLQNSRPQPIRGFILGPAKLFMLQNKSCAPTYAGQERGIHAAEQPTAAARGLQSVIGNQESIRRD